MGIWPVALVLGARAEWRIDLDFSERGIRARFMIDF
jgi:hypothetical protein